RQLGVPHRSEVASLEEDGALARAVEAAEQLEQRRLAGAARSDHREEVAAVDHEVDLAHRAYLRAAHGVGAADAPELVGGCVVHQPRWRSASAGRRRAARRPPTAPATSPAATASTTARRTTFASIGALSATFVEPVAIEPCPNEKKPVGCVSAVRETVACSVGPSASTSFAAPMPTATPNAPPTRPWRSASPVTCRTTIRCGQPSAFSVPSSRTRFATDASVRRTAIATAARSPTAISAVPSLSVRFFASTSDPPTRLARSAPVVTDAPGSPCGISPASRETAPPEDART